jgi:hypothetical protein
MPVGQKRRHQRFYVLNSEHQSYAWIDAKFYHHGVTQQSHHRMENRGSPQQILRADGPRPWHCGSTADNCISTTDECMGSTVLRDVLTIFQNGDLYLGGTSLFKVHKPLGNANYFFSSPPPLAQV